MVSLKAMIIDRELLVMFTLLMRARASIIQSLKLMNILFLFNI